MDKVNNVVNVSMDIILKLLVLEMLDAKKMLLLKQLI